jgi:hypothetical protein
MAATYYVSTNGNNSTGNGTEGNPYATIDYADQAGLLLPGDTVIVEAGTYPQASSAGVVLENSSGTTNNPIVYITNGPVLIDQSGAAAPSYGIEVLEDGIVLSGFEIKGANHGVYINGSSTLYPGGDVTVSNCMIHDADPIGDSSGVFLDDAQGTNYIVETVIYNINASGQGPWSPVGAGIRASSGNTINVWNNTLDNCYLGVFYYGSSLGGVNFPTMTTYNNIVVNSAGWAFVNPWDTSSGQQTSDYNLVYNDAITYGNYPAGNNGPTAHDVSGENPDFVFEANYDYELLADSPAVDAGTNVGLPFTGSAPNIGAYQGTNAPEELGTISGQVTANVTGNPGVGGVTIQTANGFFSTTTAANGDYQLVVPAGNVSLEAIGHGLATQIISTNIGQGGALVLNYSLSVAGSPKTYYVATTGNDTNSGTSSQPWATIGHGDAAGLLNPGDTVVVTAGTYAQATGSGVSVTNIAGYNFAPVTYTAQGSVVIDQSGFSGSTYGFNVAEPGVNINGFEIIGAAHGIYLGPGSSYSLLSSNLIHDANASGQNADGIFVNESANVTVERNVIYNITSASDSAWSPVGCGIRDADSPNLLVINNTIDNCYLGVFFYGSSLAAGPYGSLTTENNIVVDCAGWAFVNPWDNTAVDITSGYNLVYNNVTDYGNYPGGNNAPPPTDQGDKNPEFVDEATHDYQLQTNSSALNTGTYVGLPFIGPGPDIGAFESSYIPPVHTYYVATNGNDSNPGTSSQPWASIGNGDLLGMVHAGDTVIVEAGTYVPTNAGIFLTNSGGTASEAVNYEAQGTVIISETNYGAGPSWGFYVGVSGVSIQGFQIVGAEHGVYLAPGTAGCTVDSCYIHDAGAAAADQNAEGVFADHSISATVSRNIIYNIIDLYFDTPWSPVGCGVRDGESPNLKVINNTIDYCYLGVYFYGNIPGSGPYAHITTENNIVVNCVGWAFVNPWDGAVTDFTSGYNLVYSDVTDYGNYPTGNNGPLPTDVTGNPDFVDESAGNYNLMTNSPAINAGVEVGLPYVGSAPDIGAIDTGTGVAPMLISAKRDSVSSTLVTVLFTEPLNAATATNLSDYSINYGVTVTGATVTNLTTVLLTTTPITSGGPYILTVNSVQNPAGNQIATNSTIEIAVPHSPTTFYVNASTGSDTNSGLGPQAWQSIANGDIKGLVSPGDTVIVQAGTYPQSSSAGIVLQSSPGTASSPIVYRANGTALIDQSAASAVSYGIQVLEPGIVLSGFEIKGANHGIFLEGVAPGAAADITVSNCVIHDSNPSGDSSGVYLDQTGGTNIVAFNIIYNIDAATNAVWSPVGAGVRDSAANDVLVLNNTIDNCYLGVFYYGAGFGSGPYGQIVTENNIVSDCSGWGFVNPWDVSPGPFVSGYNLVYNNGTDYGNYPGQNSAPLPTDVADQNPQFVDEATNNYNLEPTSPAIGAGTNVGYPFTGKAPTIGAIQPVGLELSVAVQGHTLTLSWQGTATLQSATNISGPWSTVNGATSPYQVTTTGLQMFFRLEQ